jgi:hypothetical protein
MQSIKLKSYIWVTSSGGYMEKAKHSCGVSQNTTKLEGWLNDTSSRSLNDHFQHGITDARATNLSETYFYFPVPTYSRFNSLYCIPHYILTVFIQT